MYMYIVLVCRITGTTQILEGTLTYQHQFQHHSKDCDKCGSRPVVAASARLRRAMADFSTPLPGASPPEPSPFVQRVKKGALQIKSLSISFFNPTEFSKPDSQSDWISRVTVNAKHFSPVYALFFAPVLAITMMASMWLQIGTFAVCGVWAYGYWVKAADEQILGSPLSKFLTCSSISVIVMLATGMVNALFYALVLFSIMCRLHRLELEGSPLRPLPCGLDLWLCHLLLTAKSADRLPSRQRDATHDVPQPARFSCRRSRCARAASNVTRQSLGRVAASRPGHCLLDSAGPPGTARLLLCNKLLSTGPQHDRGWGHARASSLRCGAWPPKKQLRASRSKDPDLYLYRTC